MALGVETFAVLAMAVRDRGQRGILETFVMHDVGAPKKAIDALADLKVPDQITDFLKVAPDALDQTQREALPLIFSRARGLTRMCGVTVSALLDACALLAGKETIGDGIQRTTRRFGLYRAGTSLFLGALLGHLFWPTP